MQLVLDMGHMAREFCLPSLSRTQTTALVFVRLLGVQLLRVHSLVLGCCFSRWMSVRLVFASYEFRPWHFAVFSFKDKFFALTFCDGADVGNRQKNKGEPDAGL